MDIEQFWQLIERTHAESNSVPPEQFKLLVQALVQMPVDEILDYQHIQDELMDRIYTTEVWNAAYMMTSCGDDSFTDFRGWLICQGKTIYENALQNPDSLADIVNIQDRHQTCWESLTYVSGEAYWQKTNSEEDIPVSHPYKPLTGNLPLGVPNKRSAKYYPKLWAKFGWMWKLPDDEEID